MRNGSGSLCLMMIVALVAAGCGGARSVRYLVPLAGSPHEAQARSCVNECDRLPREDERLRCWKKCPGAQVAEDQECGPAHQPPRAFCRVKEHGSATSAVGTLVLVVVGVATVALVILMSSMDYHTAGDR